MRMNFMVVMELSVHRYVYTLGVLIFAGTNFREFFSPYIRGYLFSRMSFYSTFAGTNFREWVEKFWESMWMNEE